MTEDEAKTKWCPFARTARASDTFSANRDRDGGVLDRKHTCIASDCMAFRWAVTPDQAAQITVSRQGQQPGEPSQAEDGYCGLAGAPR